jgi:hypothetical protein
MTGGRPLDFGFSGSALAAALGAGSALGGGDADATGAGGVGGAGGGGGSPPQATQKSNVATEMCLIGDGDRMAFA